MVVRFDGGMSVWQIDVEPGMFSQMPLGFSTQTYAVKEVKYGKVPAHFVQSIPDVGPPEPLETGPFLYLLGDPQIRLDQLRRGESKRRRFAAGVRSGSARGDQLSLVLQSPRRFHSDAATIVGRFLAPSDWRFITSADGRFCASTAERARTIATAHRLRPWATFAFIDASVFFRGSRSISPNQPEPDRRYARRSPHAGPSGCHADRWATRHRYLLYLAQRLPQRSSFGPCRNARNSIGASQRGAHNWIWDDRDCDRRGASDRNHDRRSRGRSLTFGPPTRA